MTEAKPSLGDALPLVSIIIANYNYGQFLGEAIQSALDQTYANLEVILVDDGSTDDSLAVASRFPIQVFPRENGGVSVARNFGAAQSRGAFLIFLDSDDKFEPQAVEHLVKALATAPPQVAYAYCQMRSFGSEERLYPSKPFSPRALVTAAFVNASALVRRDAFEAVGGFDPTWLLGHEDMELWVRMLYHGLHGLLVPEPLIWYRRHAASRNVLNDGEKRELKWRLILTYPGLFWRKILKHPLKCLYLLNKLGESRKRHGPSRNDA